MSEQETPDLTGRPRLLVAYISNIAGGDGESSVEVNIRVSPEGTAQMQMGYRMTVIDGASFPLDDGQDEMFAQPSGGRAEEDKQTPGDGKTENGSGKVERPF